MLQLKYSLFALSYYVVTVNNIMHFSNGLGWGFFLCYFPWPDYSLPLAHSQWLSCLWSPSNDRKLNSNSTLLLDPSDEITVFCGHSSSRSASGEFCCYFIEILPEGLVIAVLSIKAGDGYVSPSRIFQGISNPIFWPLII